MWRPRGEYCHQSIAESVRLETTSVEEDVSRLDGAAIAVSREKCRQMPRDPRIRLKRQPDFLKAGLSATSGMISDGGSGEESFQ